MDRDNLGRFKKGVYQGFGFKKGVVPATCFKKGMIPKHKRFITFIKECIKCKNIFTKPDNICLPIFKTRKYCSRKCKANDPKQKEIISVMFKGKWSEEKKRKHSSYFKKGKESHRWIKDRNKLKIDERKKSYDTKYKYWMLAIKKRDKWKCRIINKDCKGRLEAHHILDWENYPELRYEINNGITLCHAHHPRGRAKEKRMVSCFMELLSVSK